MFLYMYETNIFERLLGLAGFSETLLKNHFTLYGGYVANTNKLADALAAMLKDGKTGAPEYAELKRRFGWEFCGMRLHELYFGNLKNGGTLSVPITALSVDGDALDESSELAKKIAANFGSVADWEKDFRAAGALRGIGWVILYYDKDADRLFNVWINEHDAGHLAGCAPLLVMDVFEHAFITQYGLKRADYIEAFMKAVDWEAVAGRLQ